MPKTRSLYSGTVYGFVYAELGLRKVSDYRPEKCPVCSEDVYSREDFKVHIEKKHPADVKHKKKLKASSQLISPPKPEPGTGAARELIQEEEEEEAEDLLEEVKDHPLLHDVMKILNKAKYQNMIPADHANKMATDMMVLLKKYKNDPTMKMDHETFETMRRIASSDHLQSIYNNLNKE